MKIFILLLILCVSLVQGRDKKFLPKYGDQNPRIPYIFYVFAREWPGTVCKTGKCTKEYLNNYNGKDWNLHGLWPNGLNSDPCNNPSQCSADKYDQSLVDASLAQWMDSRYVGCYSSSIDFRSHEFEKHGTCYNYQKSTNLQQEINEFFQKIKDLDEQYDIENSLEKNGIVPSDTQMYDAKQFTDAFILYEIYLTYGQTTVNLRCQFIDHIQYLQQIYITLDLNFDLVMNYCNPRGMGCDVNKKIMYPKFQLNKYND